MGTIPASSILDRVGESLFDATRVQWPEAEVLKYLSDGQRMVVQLRPEANPKNISVVLDEGSKQDIPAGGFQLLDVVRNLTPTTGVIRPVGRSVLDRIDPDWHVAPAAAVAVRNYVYDTKDRYHFYVYPARTATGHTVEIIYSAAPAEILLAASLIEIDDIYEPNLYHFCMYRALIKDIATEAKGSPMQAQEHYRLFATPLLGKAAIDQLLFPLQQMERETR